VVSSLITNLTACRNIDSGLYGGPVLSRAQLRREHHQPAFADGFADDLGSRFFDRPFCTGHGQHPRGGIYRVHHFGVGVAPFWPTMLGVVSERFPRGGALLLAITGAGGNLSIALFLPIIGNWYDAHGAATAFRYVSVLPAILIVIFGILIHLLQIQRRL